MSWRFRKRIPLAPGLFVNLTKRGLSSVTLTERVGSLRGSYNVNARGFRATLSLIGTGFLYTSTMCRWASNILGTGKRR